MKNVLCVSWIQFHHLILEPVMSLVFGLTKSIFFSVCHSQLFACIASNFANSEQSMVSFNVSAEDTIDREVQLTKCITERLGQQVCLPFKRVQPVETILKVCCWEHRTLSGGLCYNCFNDEKPVWAVTCTTILYLPWNKCNRDPKRTTR